MTVNLKLLKGVPARDGAYPLTYIISHHGKKKKYRIAWCLPEHWLASEGIVSKKQQ